MAFWLFKTEPGTFSWDDQVRAGSKGEEWNGVRNALAQKNMRAMKVGDLGFFYHSVHEKEIVGVVKVVGEIHPDSTDATGRWNCVDVAAVGAFSAPRHTVGDQGRAKTCEHGACQELSAIRAARERRGVGFGLPHGRLQGVSRNSPPRLPAAFASSSSIFSAIVDSACYP